MRYFDRILQRWRIRKALQWLPEKVRLIDVGAYEGELFEMLGKRLSKGFGVEPLISMRRRASRYEIVSGFFPKVRPDEGEWDAVTMLAVLEHIPKPQQADVATACHQLLRRGGRIVITVPAPAVDLILILLKRVGMIDGMSLEEHYGFEPRDLERVFDEPRFRLVRHKRFQLGLNHLYVFEKVGPAGSERAPE